MQWRSDAVAGLVALTLVTSVVVFWLAHVWSEVVGRRLGGRIAVGDAMAIARSEATMLTASIVPVLVLVIGQVAGIAVEWLIGAALLVSIAQLFLWGLAVGRAAHSSPVVALGIALIDCAFGIAIVCLKVLVLH